MSFACIKGTLTRLPSKRYVQAFIFASVRNRSGIIYLPYKQTVYKNSFKWSNTCLSSCYSTIRTKAKIQRTKITVYSLKCTAYGRLKHRRISRNVLPSNKFKTCWTVFSLSFKKSSRNILVSGTKMVRKLKIVISTTDEWAYIFYIQEIFHSLCKWM